MKMRTGLWGCRQGGVEIQRRTRVGDGHGGWTTQWVQVRELWKARIWSEQGQIERDEPGILHLTSHKIQGQALGVGTLQEDDRIVDGTETYRVMRVYDPGGYDQLQDATRADLLRVTQVDGD